MTIEKLDYDTFCMRRYVAPILPWAMASGGVSMAISWFGSVIRGYHNLDVLALLQIGGGAVLVVLAWICRVAALRGHVRQTTATTIVYGLLFTSLGCLIADNNQTGLLVAFPFCMILLVTGSFFAMNIWQLLAGFLATMTPPVLLAAHIDVELLTTVIPRLLLLTMVTGVTFCILAGRFRRTYFDLLQREQERSRRDPLTGLLNRVAWYERVAEIQTTSPDSPHPDCVLYLDIDFFKQVNDSHGHSEGDRVLQRLAAGIASVLGDDEVAARFGGEEFVIFLPRHEITAAAKIATRIQQALAGSEGGTTPITVSIGIATLGESETLEMAVNRADQALLQAKADGRNRVRVASPPVEYPEAALEPSRTGGLQPQALGALA